MAETDIQNQISELNRKLDILLESIELQNRKREEFDDFVEDASIVAKDAFRQTVTILDKSQVEIDSADFSGLLIKILQNLGTFHEMLDMIESARDFMKDASPILHQVGLDAVNKMNELDQKGYFEYAREVAKLLERFTQTYTAGDIRNLQASMDSLAGIVRNLTEPSFIAGLENITRAVSTVKMDDKLDNVSMWTIFRRMRSPEVRKSLSYTLRLIQAINK